MWWIGSIRCENIRRDFVARTFALIAPVQPILHRVSCNNEMVPDAPKHYETEQNMSLGSNGVDWVRSLWKHQTRLCGTNFCINCTSSANFAPSLLSYKMLPNAPKHYEKHHNMSLGSDAMDWADLLQRILLQLCGTNFCINRTSSAHFAPSFVQ